MSEKARVGKTAVLCFSPSEGGMEHDAAFMAQKIRQHLGDFHGMLYPSHGEGFGNAFVVGLASGMHGFSYDNTVFPELRSLGLDFHMLADRQTEAMVEAIEAVWRERLPLSTHNIARCRELFSVEREMAVLPDYLV
ncbi:hypothetical protein [Halomonas sp.]|uniref:glycosyltransferase n=1 Tax=Halomonas sp. TaxID=1486246 RepID=UPI002621B5E1|nr:hypothetical protein [Halomonas sp.]